MAAGDFSASELLRAQVYLNDMFASPITTKTELLAGEAEAARALLPRQRTRTHERLTGGKCVGIDVLFMRPSAADVDSGDAPADCDTPDGVQGVSVKAEYDTEVLARSSVQLEDGRCDNFISFQQEFAEQVAHLMARNRRQINNNVVIADLITAAQPNMDTFMDSMWDGTTNTRIIVPEADFTWENFNEFRIVAKNNNFFSPFFLSGRLLNSVKWMAGINAANEGERAAEMAFKQQEIFFDERDLDPAVGYKTMFAIDPNSYFFWNTFRSPAAMTLIDPMLNKYVWSQPDPILRWNHNGVLKPVIHEMEMVKTCTGRDSQEFLTYTYNIYSRILGGFGFAPVGPDGETGVLQFSIE